MPSILFVVVGAPLRANRSLSAALSGITAVVVGVIANLALYFALHRFSETDQHTWGPIKTGLPVPTPWSGLPLKSRPSAS